MPEVQEPVLGQAEKGQKGEAMTDWNKLHLAEIEAYYTQPDGRTVPDDVAWLCGELKEEQAELAEVKAKLKVAQHTILNTPLFESPSVICLKYSVQCCDFCDDMNCGDNTSAGKKELAKVKGQRDSLAVALSHILHKLEYPGNDIHCYNVAEKALAELEKTSL